jgi:hypothetical protein
LKALQLKGVVEQVELQASNVVKPTTPHDHLLGAALKPKRGKGSAMSVKQLEFLKWGYNLGVANLNHKLTPDRAAEAMKLAGTAAGEEMFTTGAGVNQYMKANTDGKPRFRVYELLDVWRIKPWFAQQKQQFQNKVAAQMKATAAAAAQPEVEIEIDLEMDDGEE